MILIVVALLAVALTILISAAPRDLWRGLDAEPCDGCDRMRRELAEGTVPEGETEVPDKIEPTQSSRPGQSSSAQRARGGTRKGGES